MGVFLIYFLKYQIKVGQCYVGKHAFMISALQGPFNQDMSGFCVWLCWHVCEVYLSRLTADDAVS